MDQRDEKMEKELMALRATMEEQKKILEQTIAELAEQKKLVKLLLEKKEGETEEKFDPVAHLNPFDDM